MFCAEKDYDVSVDVGKDLGVLAEVCMEDL